MVHPNSPEYVGIEFKVWAPELTRVTKKLYLLGSLKELGAWNIDKALKAFPTSDMHVWTVEASLPAMSHFEWVWLTTNLNRGDVKWERSTKRNRTIDCFSGTLHTIWGEGDEVFLQSATCLEVTTFLRVDEGFTLVLTGSTPSAGEWNLHHAKPATEFPKRSGYWKIHMAFDALTNLEFKWAVVKEKDHGVLRMQEKLPHSIFGRKSWMRAVAPWNTPIVVVVDTPLLCDLPDTMRGRTDVIVKARKKRAEEIKTWLLQADSDKASSANAKNHARVQPSPVERPASMSLLGLEAPIIGVASGIIATPTFSLSSVIARQKTPDPDDVKNRDNAAKAEKTAIQMYKKYSEETAVHAIKGRGQKIVPTDKMNMDITNQVPLLDGGITLLMFSKPELLSENAEPGVQESSVIDRKDNKKVKSTSSSPAYRTDTLAQRSEEKPSAIAGVQQFIRSLLSSETVFAGSEYAAKTIDSRPAAGSDKPVVPAKDKDFPQLSSFIPPTFSMLQAQAEEITRHPIINSPKRKITITRVYTSQSSKPKTPPEPTSLFEKFKQKSQESLVSAKPSIYKGPATPSRGQSSPSLPSHIGTEDISKSPLDLKEEQTNRKLWDRMREKAIKEQEDNASQNAMS